MAERGSAEVPRGWTSGPFQGLGDDFVLRMGRGNGEQIHPHHGIHQNLGRERMSRLTK